MCYVKNIFSVKLYVNQNSVTELILIIPNYNYFCSIASKYHNEPFHFYTIAVFFIQNLLVQEKNSCIIEWDECIMSCMTLDQGGITCEAIDEPRKSSKAIDKRVIINFCDKNVVITRFCNKNVSFYDKMSLYVMICVT